MAGLCRVAFYVHPFPSASTLHQCFTYSEFVYRYGEMSQVIAHLYSFNWLDFIVKRVMAVDLYIHICQPFIPSGSPLFCAKFSRNHSNFIAAAGRRGISSGFFSKFDDYS